MISRRRFLGWFVAAPIVGPAVVRALGSSAGPPAAMVEPAVTSPGVGGLMGLVDDGTVLTTMDNVRKSVYRWP